MSKPKKQKTEVMVFTSPWADYRKWHVATATVGGIKTYLYIVPASHVEEAKRCGGVVRR